MEHLVTLAVAAAISLAVNPIMARLAPQLGLVDVPDARKVHVRPIPRVGGWGIAIGALVALLLWLPVDRFIGCYLFGAVVLMLSGAWDDRHEIGHYAKFSAQLLAVAPMVFWADLQVVQFPMIAEPLPSLLAAPFTVFALIGMINATNHSDGLDGLAGGEAVLSLTAIAALGWLAGDAAVPIVALAATGAIAGFLRHNNHPAALFMGDSGSQFIGFTLGVLAVALTQRADPSLSPGVVLLLLGLPIADILVVFAKRATSGMNWFRATRNHVHHRLLDLGLDQRLAVTTIYGVHALLVIVGVFFSRADDALLIGAYLAVVGLLFLSLWLAERRSHRADGVAVRAPRASHQKPFVTVALPRRLLTFAIPAYLFALALTAPPISSEYAMAGAALAALMLVGGPLFGSSRALMNRALLYLAATYVTYGALQQTSAIPAWQTGSIMGLALLLVMTIIFSPRRRYFEFHPTGFDLIALTSVAAGLILFVALQPTVLAPSLPLMLIVLYYGIELISIERRGRRNPLKPLLALALLAMVFPGL